MADYDNAYCYPLSATSEQSGADLLEREHGEVRGSDLRCSLRPVSTFEQMSVVGNLGISVFRCRLRSPIAIKINERIVAKLDDEDEWRKYVVKQSKRYGAMWSLMVQREGV